MISLSPIPDFIPAFPEIALAILIMVLLMVGVFRKDSKPLMTTLSQCSLGIILLLVFMSAESREVTFSGGFVSDHFSQLMKIILLIGSIFLLMVTRRPSVAEAIDCVERPILMLFAILGMMVMLSANDFLVLFVGLELHSLSLYILASMRRKHVQASEAGLKYFVLGALATGLLLYGISLIYGFAGTTNFEQLSYIFQNQSSPSTHVMIGFSFILAALAFKVSAVPFHMWTPDVYQGTPTSVTVFLASASKFACFGLLMRVLASPFIGLLDHWQGVLTGIAVASMLWAAFAALKQANIKRLLAYSSIGNMGYAMIGLIVANQQGWQASLVYLLVYFVTTFGFFACLLHLTHRQQEVGDIQDLRGLSQIYPGTTIVMTLLLFSMAGIPPFPGFLAKLYLFKAAISAEMYSLAIIGVLSSVVAAAYYLKVIRVAVMNNPRATTVSVVGYRKDPMILVTLACVVGFMLVFFIQPGPFLHMAEIAASSLQP